MIGRYDKPRCFKNVKQLPIHMYRSNKKAWMTSTLFEEWISNWDKKLNRKVALILDNCAAHPKLTSLKNIELFFLPPNTTSKTQPMDQGVIQNLKLFYRKQLALRRLIAHEKGENFQINLYHSMVMLRDGWRKVKPETIINGFKKAGFEILSPLADDSENDEVADFERVLGSLRPVLQLPETTTVETFVSFDDNFESSGGIDDCDIVQQVARSLNSDIPSASSGDSKEGSTEDFDLQTVSASDALCAAEILNRYFDATGIPEFTASLQKMTSCIEKDKIRSLSQSKIVDFFIRPVEHE